MSKLQIVLNVAYNLLMKEFPFAKKVQRLEKAGFSRFNWLEEEFCAI